jgi:replication factor A2
MHCGRLLHTACTCPRACCSDLIHTLTPLYTHSRFTGMDYEGTGGYSQPSGAAYNNGFGRSNANTPDRQAKAPVARRPIEDQTVIPVTISMVLGATQDDESGLEGVKLADGRPIYQVRLVVAVRDFTEQSTKDELRVEDGTGLITVHKWADGNMNAAIAEIRQEYTRENIYVKIIGHVKMINNVWTIVADSIRQIKTGNEIAHHLLDVVYTAQKYMNKKTHFRAPANMWSQANPISTTSFQNKPSGTDITNQVLEYVRNEGESSDVGVNVRQCARYFGGQFAEGDIRRQMHALAAEGIIYSTVDEDHYKYAM